MKVSIFDNDDCTTKELEISTDSAGFASIIATLDGIDHVYTFINVDENRSVIVIGNGSRFVVNLEQGGNVKWLVQSSTDNDELVELVEEDPSRTFSYRTTVSADEAISGLRNVWGINDLPEGVVWE